MVNCGFCNQIIGSSNKFCNKNCYYSYLKTCSGNRNKFSGKKHSKETISVLSQKARLRTHSEETKKKIGLIQKGVTKGPMAEETKRKLGLRIKNAYAGGRVVWNKGLTKETSKSVKSTSEKLSELGKQLIGDKNPFFGKHHSPKTKSRHSFFMKGRFVGKDNAFFGKTHSEKTKRKLSDSAKNRSRLPEVKARLREQGVNAVLLGKKHSTKIELMVKDELEKNDVDFIFQYKFRNSKGQYVCVSDFAFPRWKTILEVNGDFHHANPKIYAKNDLKPIQLRTILNDERKKLIYEEEGWRLMVLWGSDITADVHRCMTSFLKELKL